MAYAVKKPVGKSKKNVPLTGTVIGGMDLQVVKPPMEKDEEAILFLSAELLDFIKLTHREHLNTNSYAKHEALKCLYESLNDKVDCLCEIILYKIKDKENDGIPNMECSFEETKDMPMMFRDKLKDVSMRVDKVCLENAKDCPSLDSVLSSISEIMYNSLYKLNRLF